MRTSELYEIEIYCRDIARLTGDLVNWEWDDKFMTIQAKFAKPVKKPVFSALKRTFESLWTMKTLKNAPESIRRIVEALGGIKEGQYMFFSNSNLEIMIYGAWWPWATGDQFTVRLGIVTENMPEEEDLMIKRLFHTWFGI